MRRALPHRREPGDGPRSLFPAPDLGTCAACLRELEDPADRRYGYPFLNCTDCGPRFTIIDRLPYDRERTSMASSRCARLPRRVPRSGIDAFTPSRRRATTAGRGSCSWTPGPGARRGDPLEGAVTALRAGAIVAVKGLGGYHLACDATNAGGRASCAAGRAARPSRWPSWWRAWRRRGRLCVVSTAEASSSSPTARPIVLLEQRHGRPAAGGRRGGSTAA